jgi:sugar O-acyltransferase (sialic acid O-acetyltransferase NeuD family)
MKKIAIIGAGGFGREVKSLIDQINAKQKTYEIIGFYDDKHYESEINGVKYLGKIENINSVNFPINLAVAIADPKTKKKIIENIETDNLEFPNLIHPTVIIGDDEVIMGRGNIICAGTLITVNITLQDFIILNLSCTVGHDTTIESYCSLMPSVNISGEVLLKEGVYVGTGAKIINQLEIGAFTIVGAGAVVSKTLPGHCTAVGIPAKPIKFH